MNEPLDLSVVLDHYDVRHDASRLGEQAIRCPVHEDRISSASTNLGKGVWHCHACSMGGDALNLIRLKEGCSYQAALAKYEGITGRSHGSVRAGARPSDAIPPGSGYRPRYRTRVSAGGRQRPGFGS